MASFGLGLLWSNPTARADERKDTREFMAFAKKVAAMKEADAQQRLALYDEYVQEHPQLDPQTATVLATYKANIYSKSLQDPDGALRVLDDAMARYQQATAPGAVSQRLVRFKTEVLASQKRWPDVEALLKAQWPAIVDGKAGTRDAAYMARNYVWALEANGHRKEIAPLLIPLLSRTPELWSGEEQWPPGALYDVLVTALVSEKRTGEALGWAKLQYQLSAFDSKSLDRSTKLLTRAWAASDDFPAIAAFAKSQSDASAPNPLDKIALPTLDAPALQAPVVALAPLTPATSASVISEKITLDLAAKRYGVAMQRAQQLLQTRLETGEGASEVTRVFKAADLNLVRANGFLAYLKGEGENPFPAFYAQHGDGDADAAPANAQR